MSSEALISKTCLIELAFRAGESVFFIGVTVFSGSKETGASLLSDEAEAGEFQAASQSMP